MQCGLTSSGGMGIAPVSWGEIKDWQEVTFTHSAWLATVIKQISRGYVAFYNEAENSEATQSPLHKHLDIQEQRRLVSHQLKNIFGRR